MSNRLKVDCRVAKYKKELIFHSFCALRKAAGRGGFGESVRCRRQAPPPFGLVLSYGAFYDRPDFDFSIFQGELL